MKHRIHAATASVLIAAGAAAAPHALAQAGDPVMVLQHDPALSDRLKRSNASCVELAKVGRLEDAMPYCNLAIRYTESGSPGGSVDTSLQAAAARSNRAVVSWLMRRDDQAAADMAVAAAQMPGASFVRKNLAVMGMEPPASDAGRRRRRLTFNRAGRGGFVTDSPLGANLPRQLIYGYGIRLLHLPTGVTPTTHVSQPDRRPGQSKSIGEEGVARGG